MIDSLYRLAKICDKNARNAEVIIIAIIYILSIYRGYCALSSVLR